jgi:pyridoxal/pyridoxine/pyridoxamine kinase
MQRLAKVSNRYLVWPLETICFMVLLCSKVSFSTHASSFSENSRTTHSGFFYSCVGTFFAYLCGK